MFRSFCLNTSGNISVVFALSMGVLLMGIGVAVDLSGSVSARTRLQSAVDSGILAAARDSYESTNNGRGKVKTMIETAILANMDGEPVDIDVTFPDGNFRVVATYDYKTSIMGLFGKPSMQVAASAESPRASVAPVNIAMVIDTTASIQQFGHETALRNAAHEMINVAEAAESTVRVSIVPYGQYVNVGMAAASEPWLDTSKTMTSGVTERSCYEETTLTDPGTCTTTTETVDVYTDGVVTGTRDVTNTNCTGRVWTPTGNTICPDDIAWSRTYTYVGCAGSRDDPDNLAPAADASNRIPAAMDQDGSSPGYWRHVTCGEEILPLTTEFSDLRNKIDNLTFTGATYLPTGLMWGWRTLDPSTPYTQTAGDDPGTVSAIVLMTDGLNVLRQGYSDEDKPYHVPYTDGEPDSVGLDKFDDVCAALRPTGIQVYTVAYALPDDDPVARDETLLALANCATSPGHVFTPETASQLQDAFSTITRSLVDVRLSL